jgi:hypothetical protein
MGKCEKKMPQCLRGENSKGVANVDESRTWEKSEIALRFAELTDGAYIELQQKNSVA